MRADRCSIFLPVLQNILPDLQKTPARDRKIVAVGLSRLLTQSDRMLSPPLVQQWPVAMQALVKLFVLPQDLTTSNGASAAAADGADADDIVTADLEATGYQAAYSKLGAAEPDGRARIAAIEARIGDARELLARNLGALCAAKPGVIPPYVARQSRDGADSLRADCSPASRNSTPSRSGPTSPRSTSRSDSARRLCTKLTRPRVVQRRQIGSDQTDSSSSGNDAVGSYARGDRL